MSTQPDASATRHEIEVPLDEPCPRELADELRRRVYFVSSEILGFELVERDGVIVSVVLRSDHPLDPPALAAKLDAVVRSDLADQRVMAPKVVWRAAAPERPGRREVFDELVAGGLAGELGEGQVFLAEPLLALTDHLDDRLRALAREHLDAVEFRYPTLVPTRTLDACGYVSSFPQYLMFVTRLHSDVDTYREFTDAHAAGGGRTGPDVLARCDNVDYCLPPTMCFHTFGQFRGRRLDTGTAPVTAVTARGKSFRFESRYATTLERLWDFTIREIVLLGERSAVLSARERLMHLVFELVDELGLSGWCEVGNDPFFCHADTADRVWSQRLLELKYELRLGTSDGRSVAAGSFNFHDEFFGDGLDIRRSDGAAVSSGCAGFGLERLAYAFLCQHGLDVQDWPRAVAAAVATDRPVGAGRVREESG